MTFVFNHLLVGLKKKLMTRIRLQNTSDLNACYTDILYYFIYKNDHESRS